MARHNGASVRDGAAAKAEQRKKIIAIGGSVVLVALLAFQIPKTLKRLLPATPAAAPTTSEGPIGFTAPNATPTVPVAPPAAAIIWINGNRQMVGLKQLFPLKAPAFRLVAIDRKTMQIRVAGGSFTGGHAVITLARGKA